jgi:hypothetical protein
LSKPTDKETDFTLMKAIQNGDNGGVSAMVDRYRIGS